MLGHSHTGFALAGAMSVNSLLYRMVPAQPNDWEYLYHAAGRPITYQTIVSWFQHPTPPTEDFWLGIIFKFLFYGMIIGCTMFPDHWERRNKEGGGYELRFSHRGPTHSVAIILLFIFVYIFLFMAILGYLHLNNIAVNPLFLRASCALASAFVLAFVFHILADMITREGVKVLWPAEADIGIPPVKSLRPRTGEWGEYAWLWLFIFGIGILFTLGIVGF